MNPSDEVNAKFALLVQKKIAAEGVNRLSTREWTVVILDVISDEEEMSAAYEKRQSNKIAIRPYRINAASMIGNSFRDSDGPLTSVIPIVRELDASAKENFCVALSNLALVFNHAVTNGNRDAEIILKALGLFAIMLPGSVNADVAEKIVFGQADIQIRVTFANALVNRDFRSAPPHAFWSRLEAIVGERPEFLVAVLQHYAEIDNASDALDLIKQVPNEPPFPDQIAFPIRRIVVSIIGMPALEKRWRSDLTSSPAWFKKLFKEQVIPLIDLRRKQWKGKP